MIPDGEFDDIFKSQRMNGRKLTKEIAIICLVVPSLLAIAIMLVL